MESSLIIGIINTISGFTSGAAPSTDYLIKENGTDILITEGSNFIIPE